MKLPQRLVNMRFTVRTLALFVAWIAVALCLATPLFPPGMFGKRGTQAMTFTFRISDAESGAAIGGATVGIDKDSRGLNRSGLSPARQADSNGEAKLVVHVELSHRYGVLGPVACYVFEPFLVRVRANGYESFLASLSEYTGPNCDARSFAKPEIPIALRKKPD